MAPHVWVCAAILPRGRRVDNCCEQGRAANAACSLSQSKSDVSNFDHFRRAELGQARVRMGEGWGEGLQTIDKLEPPHPNPLPCGERESRRAAPKVVPTRAGEVVGGSIGE